MKDIHRLAVIFLTLVAAAPLAVAAEPHMVFFLADDQRVNLLGCAGHPMIQTPTMDRLAEEGVRFSNAFVTTSIGDNGYNAGVRGFAGKWSHYEESLRAPMIIMDPRLPVEPHGRTLDATVLNIDVTATIADLAPSGYQGTSLVPWMKGHGVEA